MPAELFVLFKALMGFGLPIAFCLHQLHALRKAEAAAAGTQLHALRKAEAAAAGA